MTFLYNSHFSLNPGRIDPTNAAWLNSRKPLAAVWQSNLPHNNGQRFFTVNLHLTSKDGSTSTEGSARPPINLGVDQRTSQVTEVAVRISLIPVVTLYLTSAIELRQHNPSQGP